MSRHSQFLDLEALDEGDRLNLERSGSYSGRRSPSQRSARSSKDRESSFSPNPQSPLVSKAYSFDVEPKKTSPLSPKATPTESEEKESELEVSVN